MTRTLGIRFFLLVAFATTVWGKGKIKVTFLGYDNPSGQEQDGGCCDGIETPGCPVGKCDHSFEFCITDMQGKQIGCFTYDGPPDRNSFTDQHPATIELDVREEQYDLTVNVTDMNTAGKVPVDVISVVINRDMNRINFTTQGTRQINPTTITLSIETSCSQYYYLANCTKHCVAENNCNGHYTCNQDTGDRVCEDGWRGPTCSELIPGSPPDCSIYQSSGFVSSSWSGLLTCPSDTRNFSMNITKLDNKVADISGYVTTDQTTTVVTGLFSGARNSLILHDASGNLSIDSTMHNDTLMTGVISQGGIKCSMDLQRIEGYFDACDGRGTCIRYGQEKDQFYCCCHDGTNSCKRTTTPRPTTVTSSTTPESSGMTTSTETTTTQTTTGNSTTEFNTAGPSTEPTTETTTTKTTQSTVSTTNYSSPEPTTISTIPQTSASQSTLGEVSTSESTTTLTTTTTVTTVETTKATTPTTTASTTPTTTEKPTVFEPTSVYRLMFEAVEEEMEGEEDKLVEVLKLAWKEANALHLADEHAYNISILNMKGAIGEKGVLIVEISYTVSINVTGVNISLLVTPTKAHLTKTLQTFYHTEIYTGVTTLYLEYSFSIYISGRPPLVDQYLEINQDIYDLWNTTMGTETFNITTSAVEEYIGVSGGEITRIYYFIYDNNTMVRPVDVAEPNVTSLVTLGRYQLYHHQDVNSIVRYRSTYNINIIGELTSGDQVIIRDRIQLTWNVTDMRVTNVSIALLRCERYIRPDGNFVTKVIYKVTTGNSIVYSVLQSPPNTTSFEMTLNVNNSRGDVFRLFNGTDLFRYSFHLGLYVMDKIDTRHDAIDKLMEGLENAWKAEKITQGWDVRNYMKLHCITVKRYIAEDGFVDMLLYFLTQNHQVVDGTQYKELDITVLQKYIQVTKMSGEKYQLVSAKSLDIIEERLHFTITFQGVVLSQDRKFLTGVILGSWKQLEGITAVLRHVHIRAVEEMVTEEGRIVSRLFYTFTRTELSTNIVTITNPLEKATFTENFYEKVTRNLISLSYNKHQSYNLYIREEKLFSRRYTFDLYFEAELARLDFVRVEAKLSQTLRQQLSLAKDVKVKIIKQEEYFLQQVTQTSGATRPRYWRIFYVIYQDSILVYPGFHKKVLVNDLATSFSVAGISGRPYKLYIGVTNHLLDYSYQFFLHFHERVSPKDWFKIKARLEKAWQIQFEVNVSVQIQEVEEVLSIEGVSFWRLVYYMTDAATNTSIYPGNWKTLNLETVYLDFTNVYGYTYTVVDYTDALMRISSTFWLLSSESVSEYYTLVNEALSKTWCDMITGLGYNLTCGKVDITLIKTPYIKMSSGITIWPLYYFMEYDGISIDILTWPILNIYKFTHNIGEGFPIRFYNWFDLDLSFWNFQFFLRFKSRVEKKDYASVTAAILETFKQNNAEYTNSTGIKVVVDTQNEVLTDAGEWEWKLGYHIEVNGTVIKPEESHVNATQVQTVLKTNTSLVVSVESSSTDTIYTSTENLGSIFVQSTIHKEDYAKFKASLEEYYKNKTGGSSNISVVVGPVEEVITKDGKSEWKLSYFVKENGKTIRPLSINTTEEKDFLQWFHFKSNFGFEYKLKVGSSTHVDSKTTIFGINMKAKVSTSSYSDIEAKLSEIITKTNPDLIVPSTTKVSAKILDQQELVTDTGETVWRLHYGVYVNGAKVDASYLKTPSRNDLEKLLVFKGPNGMENGVSEISVTETHTELSLHELRLNRPMSQTDVSKISEAVRASWAKVLNVSKSELQIDFKRSNEYVMKNGKSSWGWTYSLKWNSTILTRTDLSIYELKMKQELKASLVSIVTSRGDNYTLVDETSSLEYAKHFPVYFTVKVAQKDMETIKEKLESVWSVHKG
ncbi:uncharacterized protein LOC124275345 isoform X2 [Haliotis rubra]|uniref:uncharacterized protein LOC124275345 isoform X2 n=1 Tax=Haliotis rubra TaxID=36100 RepID=UPI001EE5AE4D|nr:uncharacterized protein LOC124275345 isoform X2 [Haliotis rubra]